MFTHGELRTLHEFVRMRASRIERCNFELPSCVCVSVQGRALKRSEEAKGAGSKALSNPLQPRAASHGTSPDRPKEAHCTAPLLKFYNVRSMAGMEARFPSLRTQKTCCPALIIEF